MPGSSGRRPSRIIANVSSSLSGIAIDKRRQLAATLGLFSVLFIAVGAVAATGASTGIVRAFVVIALLVAVMLALLGWGVAHSVKLDLVEKELDTAIEQAVLARGGSMCDCGHEHDPTELHLVGDEQAGRTDDSCAHDGAGAGCTHTCDTCVLAGLRPAPSPTHEKAMAGTRPWPRPRPAARATRPSPSRARPNALTGFDQVLLSDDRFER